jgi:hypothetical protein
MDIAWIASAHWMRLAVTRGPCPRQSPELVEAGLRSRSAGQSEDAPPENHYRGPKLSLVEHLRRDAISSVMVVIQL